MEAGSDFHNDVRHLRLLVPKDVFDDSAALHPGLQACAAPRLKTSDTRVATISRGEVIGTASLRFRAFGGVNEPLPLPLPLPKSLGPSPIGYELHTAAGAVARMACGKLPDGRFVALTVVALERADLASAAFDEVAGSLALK